MAARITEPTVGASVCASGSHVWNGNIGTLMPKPMNKPAKMIAWVPRARSPPSASASTRMSKLRRSSPFAPVATKYSATKLTIISAEPKSVNKKNFSEA